MKIPLKKGVELERMRVACRTASLILDKLSEAVAPGVPTKEIDNLAAKLIADAGCKSAFLNYKEFPGHICISINEEVVHGIGGERKIQYGDLVKIDVGVVKDGWVGDTASTIPVGLITPEAQQLLDATEGALEKAVSVVRDGVRLGDVCNAIEMFVLARGYSVVREFVGHGVGRKLHEEPQIPNFGRRGTGPRLRAGMTLAIEPMVNAGGSDVRLLPDKWTVVTADRSLSAHFEHTILVTNNEPEILTWREKTRLK